MDKNMKLVLPKEVYKQCVWILKDVPRLESVLNMKHYRYAEREIIKHAEHVISAIETALMTVPPEYRDIILENTVRGKAYGDYAHENTWKRWKKQFIYEFAIELKII